ncbi:hypothetical protein ES705_05060 [subsurface metagenome]
MSESKIMINLVLEQLHLIRVMSIKGNKSPHKFLFLLMLAKLYEEDPYRENRFYLNDALEKNFIEIWLKKYSNTDHKKIFIEYPFYHLVNDKIWNLKVKKNKENIFLKYKNTPNTRFTKQRLLETIDFGYLNQDFDSSLRNHNFRKIIIKWLDGQISNISYTFLPLEKMERVQLKTGGSLQPNSFVNYLNMLHGRDANSENLAESLATNPFTGMIHVSHPLTEKIEEILQGDQKQHVILTGHAGDGKTTIAVELFKRFHNINLDQPLKEGLSRREDLDSKNKKVSLIKDLSEWSLEDRMGIIEEMLKDDDNRFFLISNSGTLLDSFCSFERKKGRDWTNTESEILKVIDTVLPRPWIFHENNFVIINLSMVDNLGVAEQIFKRIINIDRWETCKMKDCQKICPIYRNVELIKQNEKVVRERLFLAYRRMYEYGTRFTLRQLTAHLAYMITSGLNYQDIEKMMQKATPPLMSKFMFFNRFFGDTGKEIDTSARQLQALRAIRGEDFGTRTCPTWERRLWMQSEHLAFKLKAKGCVDEFENLRQYGAQLKFDDNSVPHFQARNQVRRMLYFLHDFDKQDNDAFIKTFLNSLMILNFSSWQIQSDKNLSFEVNKIKKQILHVIQEHFTGVRVLEGITPDHDLFITLSRRSKKVRQSAQIVLAHFSEDDFNLRLCEKDNGVGGTRRELIFEGRKGRVDANLSLSLPFLDYVMMRNFGEVGQNLKTAYVDRLESFKGKLLRQIDSIQKDGIMLVRLSANHTFRRQIFTVRNNTLEVIDG